MSYNGMENCTLKVLPDGKKIYCPHHCSYVSNHVLNTGSWEPLTTSLIYKIVKPGMHAIEIGGHIGYHSIHIASLIGNTGKLWVFEANKQLAGIIQENLKINNFSDFSEVVDKGVFSETCKKSLHVMQDKGTTSLYQNEELSYVNRAVFTGHVEQIIEIDCVSLDDYAQDERVDFIKMDIEGAEADVIKGAYNLLKNNDVQMIVEWWQPTPERLVQEVFFDLLGGLGYKTYGLDHNRQLVELKTYADFSNASRWDDLYVCKNVSI